MPTSRLRRLLSRFVNPPPLAFGLVFMLMMAVASSIGPSPAQAAFISVNITFTNNGTLPLYASAGHLDHGCWSPQAPGMIPPLTTVTWGSESCGVGTGTEGWVDYRPYRTPDGIHGHFYWNAPAIGSNSATDAAPSGCTSSHSGPPESGDDVSIFFTMGCSDSSGDGIADVWKLNGASFDPGGGVGPQFIDLPAMGADVGQKDIFLQLDWMQDATHNQQLGANVFKKLAGIFEANGYALHIDAGPNSILNFRTNSTWGSLSRASSTPYQASLGTTTVDANGNVKTYDWTAFNAIKKTKFIPTGRVEIFHYGLAARQIGTVSNSGISSGSNLIISLGSFTGGVGSENEQLGTLMHELGHNLGLGHGGDSTVNFKPNYFSVMNYGFQMSGITRNGETTFDYARDAQNDLNEDSLDETTGVSSAPGYNTIHYCPAAGGNPAVWVTVANAAGQIDWDCDGKINFTERVSADINGDPAQPANTLGWLTHYDDWDHLRLNAGLIGSFGASVPAPPITTVVDDLTPEMLQEILPVDATTPVTTATPDPLPNAYGWNNTDVMVTLSATDDSSGVARTEYNLDGGGWTTYTSPVVVSGDAVHTLQYRSIDRASNSETAKSLTVKIDTTPPAVTYSGNLGTYHILDIVDITCTATDALSGVQSTTCADITGPAYNFAVGANSVSATATDYAGNVGSGSTSFELIVTYSDLCTLSKRFVTNDGVARSNAMCAQLFAAENAESRGNETAKSRAIAAYLHQVDAGVRGHYLSPTDAAILTKLSGGL